MEALKKVWNIFKGNKKHQNAVNRQVVVCQYMKEKYAKNNAVA